MPMRSDAKKNYEQLLTVAREVFTQQGAEASLRDVARKAGVGLGTLYRHFPTREDLLEALLRDSFDQLTQRAEELEAMSTADEALVQWLREIIAVTHSHRGVISTMMAAIEAPHSALHSSCVKLRASGARLLERTQLAGLARADVNGADLFALIGALAWLNDQPSHAARADHLFDVISRAILLNRSGATSSP
jgi:AcrR family transcriptional regulator